MTWTRGHGPLRTGPEVTTNLVPGRCFPSCTPTAFYIHPGQDYGNCSDHTNLSAEGPAPCSEVIEPLVVQGTTEGFSTYAQNADKLDGPVHIARPSLLLSSRPSLLFIRIADFGLAKITKNLNSVQDPSLQNGLSM